MAAWLNSMAGWFGGWMFSPFVFLGGAALVASPILIHLLNRQRYRTIDWAAMDFLLEAEKRNRYRIILEDIILLLLRCLAVVLIGLLLARPFLPTGLTAGLLETASYERIVLLDDSLSMSARSGARTAMADARQQLTELIRSLADNETDDSITLLLASDPAKPVLRGERMDDNSVDDLVRRVSEIEAADTSAPLDAALLALEKAAVNRRGELNRVVYLFSDLRRRDWAVPPQDDPAEQTDTVQTILTRVAEQVNGCYVVDLGGDQTSNLAVTSIELQDKALVAGVATRLNVAVHNHGPQDASDVEVKLTAGEALPLVDRVEAIRVGETVTVPFTYTFIAATDDADLLLPPVRVRAEVVTGRPGCEDYLQADNVRYFAARIMRGLPVLVVDGDPSSVYGQNESFFLARSLAPPGDTFAGIDVDVVTENEFETLPLENYQVVVLANVYRIGEQRRRALEKWVAAGGGLAVALGDQIDEQLYNEELYAGGQGLSPVRLVGIRGDESDTRWVHFRVDQAKHPVTRVFRGENNPFIDAVLVFRWWQVELTRDAAPRDSTPRLAFADPDTVAIPTRLTDTDDSPTMIEQPFGDGRVVVFTTPVDGDWSNWPADPSYLVAMQQLVRDLAPATSSAGNLPVGAVLSQPVELTRYRRDAAITLPDQTRQPLQAMPGDGQGSATLWRAAYSEAAKRGFYTMHLVRKDLDQEEVVLFAVNVDPDEGDLRRVESNELRRGFADAPIQFVSGSAALSLDAVGAKWEIWPWVMGALLGLLAVEQLLGWAFGRKR